MAGRGTDSQTGSLFAAAAQPPKPLPARVRPQALGDVIGHDELVGPDGWLTRAVSGGELPHVIFWGPPGVGKTTIATAAARQANAHFELRSAVKTGVAELRDIIRTAVNRWQTRQLRTLLFLDEIHRFNKGQQDALLADIEDGTIWFFGATTENPAFSLNNALLSRTRIAVLDPLDDKQVDRIINRALTHPDGIKLDLDDEARSAIVAAAHGDARAALTLLEGAASLAEGTVNAQAVRKVLDGNPLRHDRSGDQHYDAVSAWIKTLRGSDVDAALYWGARLWDAGEDRRFLFRRLIIFASEDVGLADSNALAVSNNAAAAFERVGEAEGWIPFAHAVAYCAAAPKSNSSYAAFKAVRTAIRDTGTLPVPKHLRNAPTGLAKSQGHGDGYVYPHDRPGGTAPDVRYLPDGLPEDQWYRPGDNGDEEAIKRRIEAFRASRRRARAQDNSAGGDDEAD